MAEGGRSEIIFSFVHEISQWKCQYSVICVHETGSEGKSGQKIKMGVVGLIVKARRKIYKGVV